MSSSIPPAYGPDDVEVHSSQPVTNYALENAKTILNKNDNQIYYVKGDKLKLCSKNNLMGRLVLWLKGVSDTKRVEGVILHTLGNNSEKFMERKIQLETENDEINIYLSRINNEKYVEKISSTRWKVTPLVALNKAAVDIQSSLIATQVLAYKNPIKRPE